MSISRARWAGSPAFIRCGSMPGRSISRRRWRAGQRWGARFKTIKEQLRALPDHGLGYGLLRYLDAQTGAQLAALARPQLAFNYLGRFAAGAGGAWTAAAEAPLGGGVDDAMALAHCVEVNALTLDGREGPRLTAHWSFAPALVSAAEVSDLAQRWFVALEALVRHAQAPGAGGRSPSDLALLALSQSEIEMLERKHAQIEDILPLAPLQEGLLFHALYDAQAPDVYTVQLVLELAGRLDLDALEAALAALMARHSSLRAAFEHENLSRPVQVIVPSVAVPLRRLDLSLLEQAQREERLAGILAQDRAARFDLGGAPLLRFTLVRLSAQEHRLVLSNHHILLDGWSMPVLVQELLTLYGHQGDASALPEPARYRDYLAWIAGQDRAATLAAWAQALAGVEEATLVAPAGRGRAPVVPEQLTLALSGSLTAGLSEQARRLGLTLNSMLQAAWAVLLGRLLGREDVVFGVTVAGRAPELPGIESMVGLFINTLPLRVKVAARTRLRDLLAQVQASQLGLMAQQHVGLAEVQGLVGLGDLFDTLLVFENYPLDRARLAAPSGDLRLTGMAGRDATHYPLSLAAVPGERLHLRFDYRPDLFDRSSIEALSLRLVRLLEGMVADPGRPIGSVELLSGPERSRILHEWNDTARALPAASIAGAVCGAGCREPGCGCGGVCGRAAELSRARCRARAGWRTICGRSALVPRWLWGCAWSARLRWLLGCSASSRRAGLIFRSIPTTRRSGWPSCWRMRARACW